MTALETLPTEILFNILCYSSAFDPTPVPKHPLYTLAATNRHLRSVVEEYTRVLLKQHVGFTIPKKSNIFVSRKKWIKWLDNTCQLCKKKSVRKAILDPTLTCCKDCDKAHFPKISMTAAVSAPHYLTKLDLFTPNLLHPNLPPLTIGEYVCSGTDTTMISEPDILARRALIYSMLSDTTPTALKRRVTAHTKLLKHMNPTIPAGYSRWIRVKEEVKEAPGWATMRTPDTRREFVKDALKREWRSMSIGGGDEDTAIELD